jgi:hypothetical protein
MGVAFRPAAVLLVPAVFAACLSSTVEDPRVIPPPALPPAATPVPPPPAPPPIADAAVPAPPPVARDASPAPPPDAGVNVPPPPPPPSGLAIDSVSVSGFQLLVRWRHPDGRVEPPAPFDIRGVSWSPAQRGGERPEEPDYLAAADRDLPLMAAAHINVVKSYSPMGRATLDKLQAHGIAAIITVLNTADSPFQAAVESLRDHPAVLMWMVGNEWNLNRLFGTCAPAACAARIEEVARRIKTLDPRHPVATSFAPATEIPSEEDLRRLPSVDVWGLNVYSQPGFFTRFTAWRLLAQQTGLRKPFFFSEYGADAYDNLAGRADENAQAAALRRQTAEIRGQLSARNPAFPCLGGTPFEWNDEWWKRGNPAAQDSGGFANPGVAADRFANEEWWGVVDIDRKPRPAYQALKEQYAP